MGDETMDLYKHFEVYEKQGCTAMFVRLIEEQFKPYHQTALEYLIEEIRLELSWRVGPKADYLQEIQLVALTLLAKKHQV